MTADLTYRVPIRYGMVRRTVRLPGETWQLIGEIARARGLTYREVIEGAVKQAAKNTL
jgi:predicted DNA-binding ribbon-helix-helix protein